MTKKLCISFYVDNCIVSLSNNNELNDFMSLAKTLMAKGDFDLRGWEFTRDNSEQRVTNILGILWDKQNDSLLIKLPDFKEISSQKITKRSILSLSHKIFDPLGFVCPVTLTPKFIPRLNTLLHDR